MSRSKDRVDLVADVLVIGGGPAGCWAALSALEAGAKVVLAEKGYVGTSGATAAGNSSIIYTAPASQGRAKAIAARESRGLGLVDGSAVDRVLDEVYFQLDRLAVWGYGFPTIEDGSSYRGSMRGVDYLRFLRQKLIKGGATILDQSPATELLSSDGIVSGARGVRRIDGAPWQVRAGAVVIASGGCAFLSGAIGTRNLTGDGYLMAAEVGARMSGMDFSGQYGICPVGASVTKGIIYYWATFSDETGNVIAAKGDRQDIVASGLRNGRVYAILDKANERVQSGMRGQANIFMPFDRQGIDPFTQRFEVSLLYEGTVRGTGGLLIGNDTTTDIPGLYAAGDAASRESMAGATSGGGGPNSSWALATGVWAGAAATRFAQSLGPAHATRLVASVATKGNGRGSDIAAVQAGIQREILPLDRSFFRTGAQLDASAQALETSWADALAHQDGTDYPKARETLAMAATARWMVASSRQRSESRGIHRRTDLKQTDPAQTHRIASGGLDRVWAQPQAGTEQKAAQ
ncbi:MAG: FAD-binding protein [Candidatus Devosia phytovorans]|uniref:FAD-binding protein n=1 Tax=Candidatus Devosia phytovorans TaxID=3121372 RepID=A0AAJ5VTW3_9HYPH|nr:FAD-binding protein [Devosia sp.]WEK03408.1 MAG: FAD-binding protein [Devosia sp.]